MKGLEVGAYGIRGTDLGQKTLVFDGTGINKKTINKNQKGIQNKSDRDQTPKCCDFQYLGHNSERLLVI